ncbi:hypothetical protein MMC16_002050 [Acarospora aff. strigata]|nr:hypothetical protein [Acarospora aff. strigata]
MHFALPPRKSSHPPPYARPQRLSTARRRQLQVVAALAASTVLLVIYLLTQLFSSSPGRPPPGTPEVVIVTVLDRTGMSDGYIEKIKENRNDYAARHGYATFFTSTTSYDLSGAPSSWSLIPSVRHAMTLYPHSTYFFSLSAHSLIMNPSLSLNTHILSPQRLESLMLKDKPVVPPDSVIKTFSHLKGDKIDLILTQDTEALCQGSFIVRQGDWARFFLDSWFDPLYRNYNFQKAEGHALEHVVQWHPTVLTKLALVPQRIMNAYNTLSPSQAGSDLYKDDDFVVRFAGCEVDSKRNCEQEMGGYYEKWRSTWRN